MRGPFSAMYGNSSGGVIQMFTRPIPKTPEVSGDVLFGSFGTRRESVQAAGTRQGVDYLLNYSNFESDGYRAQSANEKRQATAKLGVKLSDDTKLSTLINWFDQQALDPGGLNAANLNTSYKMASPNNVAANARVIRSNTQVGFNLEKILVIERHVDRDHCHLLYRA
jgi:iron complex outermembrane receptor protein